jgi:hypothetical protein
MVDEEVLKSRRAEGENGLVSYSFVFIPRYNLDPSPIKHIPAGLANRIHRQGRMLTSPDTR